jgi:putative ABC transport system permease protein
MRRKLFTAINLACIVLTLVVLMVITALLETAFWPSGVEGKSDRFLQVYGMRSESADHTPQHHPARLQDHRQIPQADGRRRARVGLHHARFRSRSTRASASASCRCAASTPTTGRSSTSSCWPAACRMRTTTPTDAWSPCQRHDRAQGCSATRRAGPAHQRRRPDVRGRSAWSRMCDARECLRRHLGADHTFPSSDYRNELTGSFAALLLAARRRPAAHPARGRNASPRPTWSTIRSDLEDDRFWADSKLDLFARELLGNKERGADSGAGTLLADRAWRCCCSCCCRR